MNLGIHGPCKKLFIKNFFVPSYLLKMYSKGFYEQARAPEEAAYNINTCYTFGNASRRERHIQ